MLANTSRPWLQVAQAEAGPRCANEIEPRPDVVLLDLELPGEDGLRLARYLRERYDVGIIMVTGAGDVVDRIVGLESAPTTISPSLDPRELLARVKSVLRRVQAAGARRRRRHAAEARRPRAAANSTRVAPAVRPRRRPRCR